MNELLGLSARELARRVREGELSSRELVDVHIARVEEVNPRINAMVASRFDEARAEADDADARLRSDGASDLPPLFGVPCTIKESFALRGMPQTSGLVSRKGLRPSEDAPTVARLRRAGAIPLGVTNTSELCMWMESHNRVYGRTNNPYDAGRIAGGSSGGEGAIVGAGASPFGLGADVGGSIRMPAFFNGVFGHKPTGGLIPNTGQFPIVDAGAARILCTGPLARKAEDLPLLVSILAGPDGLDPGCEEMELGDAFDVDLGALRVVVVEDDGRTPVSEELRQAQLRVARHLGSLGAELWHLRFDALKDAFEIWSSTLQAGSPTPYVELLSHGGEVRPLAELMKWTMRRSDHTLPSIMLALSERLTHLLPARNRAMVVKGRALRREVLSALGPRGVMLYPSYSKTAPRHLEPLLPPTHFVYAAILNALELPVTQVPLGLDARGLPLGVQVAAAHGNDHLTMAVAMELERAFGGWTAPS